MELKFFKYHGNGNDFIIIDNRDCFFPSENLSLVKTLCDRNFGIGGDGLMLLENNRGFDFHMRYFNSDGRQSSMCGNGGRCMVKFAWKLGIIRETASFSGVDGPHEATIDDKGMVHLKMKDVSQITKEGDAYIIDTGSPHYVLFTSRIDEIDVLKRGRQIRYSNTYRNKGINVNFVEISGGIIKIRTYERGVENETLACGTGSVAAAIAMVVSKNTPYNIIKVETRGGFLEVSLSHKGDSFFTDIWLTGPAKCVFEGTTDTDTLQKAPAR